MLNVTTTVTCAEHVSHFVALPDLASITVKSPNYMDVQEFYNASYHKLPFETKMDIIMNLAPELSFTVTSVGDYSVTGKNLTATVADLVNTTTTGVFTIKPTTK